MTRMPWPEDFPDVFVNGIWRSPDGSDYSGLWDHPLYQAAKGERDVDSAMRIIDDLAKEEVVDSLRGLAIRCGKTPIVIAPSADIAETNNALAISYANWIGHELDWPVEERVFQDKTVSRDRQGGWFRLAHRASFYGQIDSATPYVIVDDVITMGGTMADLRSFIHRKGGSVIGMSAIASREGTDKQIRLGNDTLARLEEHYGSDFSSNCCELFGFPHECFTRDEGLRLLACKGYDSLRENILRARHEADASGGKRVAGR
ncbi:hypothetical protein [Zhengella mangrovi]|uniref:hypothetical protein n=1 Tax=Zhengella mangrovi TaxID=1982044 RepID=UPI0010556EAE|nr:hypothetical protein [Zhengella mangrovi]